jgi:hypothetical protein
MSKKMPELDHVCYFLQVVFPSLLPPSSSLLPPLISQKGNTTWDLIIAHFLGVDHVGHTFGSDHPAMSKKMSELDHVVKEVMDHVDEKTLVLVMGDHGMTEDGNHGVSGRERERGEGSRRETEDGNHWVSGRKEGGGGRGGEQGRGMRREMMKGKGGGEGKKGYRAERDEMEERMGGMRGRGERWMAG